MDRKEMFEGVSNRRKKRGITNFHPQTPFLCCRSPFPSRSRRNVSSQPSMIAFLQYSKVRLRFSRRGWNLGYLCDRREEFRWGSMRGRFRDLCDV